jgi:SnoaL-like domain
MTDSSLETRLAALELRVQELEDERDIRELLSRYGFNADACRDEAYVNLYTDDGSMDLVVGEGDAYGTGPRVWRGKDQLRSFIEDPEAHHKPGFYGRAMHVQGNNVVCHIHGDEATVNSYSLVLNRDGDQVALMSAGNNQWQLRKVDGAWLIVERRRRHMGGEGYIENLDATAE